MSIRHRCCCCSRFLVCSCCLLTTRLVCCRRREIPVSCRQDDCRPEQQSSTSALWGCQWQAAQQEPRQRSRSPLSSLSAASASLAGHMHAVSVEQCARAGRSIFRNDHRTPGRRDSPRRNSDTSSPVPSDRYRLSFPMVFPDRRTI